jgi:membrane-bound lytic murein transglycosylase MltF
VQSLDRLNARFGKEGKPLMRITALPQALEDEDTLEMMNAGILQITVMDAWKAKLWAQVLPKIQPHPDLAVRTGAEIGWAFRKGSPKLAAEVNAFLKEYPKVMGSAETHFKRYASKWKQLHGARASEEMAKFEQLIGYFRRYGETYGFDYLMLAAQGYQESRLDQGAKSHVGAVGVMQLMPATGAEMKVGDIHSAEANIHAGTKYMRRLFDSYFKGVPFDEMNRTLFAFASYNAGPGRVAQLRKQAEAEGLNPNVWFGNVELVAAKRVGQETVTYVRNIYKYYIAYKLELDAAERQRKLREQTERGEKAA